MSDPQELKAHEGTYASFIGMLKWSVPLIAVIAAIVVALIA